MAAAPAFPPERLVIGVPVPGGGRRRAEVIERPRLRLGGGTRADSVVTREGGDLHRHAWVALVAFVVAARRRRTQPRLLRRHRFLGNQENEEKC